MNTHLELLAEWGEWITMGSYSPCRMHDLAEREAALATHYSVRRVQYTNGIATVVS